MRLEGAGEVGLNEGLAHFVEAAVAQEDALRFGEFAEQFGRAAQGVGEAVGNGEAFFGEGESGGYDIGPGTAAVFLGGVFEAADGAGDAGGAIADDAIVGGFARRIEVHVARGFFGGAFAEVDEGGAAIGETNEHESAAAEVAGGGMSHG